MSKVLGPIATRPSICDESPARARRARRVFGRLLLIAISCILCTLVLSPSTHAQTPTPDATLRAFRIAEKQIRDWAMPAEPAPKGPETADAPKAVGACVTLKLRGKVVGRGQAWSEVLAGPDAANPFVLRQAIRAAMQQAEPDMGVPNDAMRDAAIKLIAPEVLISVELAGPFSVVEFNTWDDAELALRPGLDGVAVRVEGAGGTGKLHAIFPSQMMLANMLPHRGMGAMAAIAMGEGGAAAALDDPRKLREKSGLKMYRFRVGQVVQTPSSCEIVYRGSQPHAVSEVADGGRLRMFAESLAKHIWAEASTRDGPIGLPVPLDSRAASYAGRVSLAVVALASYERWRAHGPGFPKDDARTQFIEQLQDRSMIAGKKANDPVTTAFVWSGLSAWDRGSIGPGAPSDVPTADWLGRIDDAFSNNAFQDRVALFERSLIAFAIVPEWGQHSDIESGEFAKIEARVESARRSINESSMVSTMPWFGWAELRIEHYKRYINTSWRELPPQAWKEIDRYVKPNDIPSALALRRMRDECWKHQLSITDAGADAMDMAGGIVFTSGMADGRGNPYPTWQCVRPLAFMATMLRDSRLTEPHERSTQIVNLMQAARFLRQLQVDESSAWMYPDPKLAIGGIRASTWDNSLPIDATSMTLLFTVELIKSLDELSAQKASVNAAPAATPSAPPVPEPSKK